MDKILSARVDEVVLRRLSYLARRLRSSKKAVIERAIIDLAERVESGDNEYELVESFGAWKRDGSPEVTTDRVREAFQSSMERHRR